MSSIFLIGIVFFFDIDGNIPISGSFDIHDYDQKYKKCGKINAQTGVMYLEAMLFALDKINNNSTFLYGNKLAARLFDSCSNHEQLKRNLDYSVNYYKSQGTIGPQYSEDATIASIILDSFQRSLVSYSASSPDLSDRTKYRNFFRTVPSYYGQIRAMIELALHFKWTYVGLVYSSVVYEKAASYFEARASSSGICVPQLHPVDKGHQIDHYVHILKSISKEDRAMVVFLFLADHDLNLFLSAAKKTKNDIHNLTFVGSNSWGSKESIVKNMKDTTIGSLTIQPSAKHVQEFEEYFMSLNPDNNRRNPWFSEFWEYIFNCTLKNNTRNANVCSRKEQVRPGVGYHRNTPVLHIITAVYAYAYVFRQILEERCISKQIAGRDCVLKSNFLKDSSNLRDIRDMLATIRFEEPFGKCIFSFQNGTQFLEQYDILNVKVDKYSNNYYYDVVGFWRNNSDMARSIDRQHDNNSIQSSLFLDRSKIVWRNYNKMPPKSVCSDNCADGLYQQYKDSLKCCWECKQCGFNNYVFNNTCIPCDLSHFPDTLLKKCVALPTKYLSIENPIAASIVTLSSVGLISTAKVVVMFLKKFQHPLMKASGRELCVIMLRGIMITYLSPVIFFLKPSVIVCLVQKLIISSGLTFSFAPLASKLNRIYRIFQCSKKMQLRPPVVSPKSQILISSLVSLIGILLVVVSIKNDPPKINQSYPSHRKFVVEYCVLNPFTLAINLAYSSVLMIISTWYAFKTRHFPENFNETKYIGFTMYTTCLVLCGSLPPFFMMNDNGHIRVFIMCFVCEAIATINLTGIFVPKLVKVLRQIFPDQTVRMIKSGSTTSSMFELTRENSFRSVSASTT